MSQNATAQNIPEFPQFSFTWIFVDIILLVFLILFLISLLLRYTFLYWAQHNIPYLMPSLPAGNINDLIFGRKTFGLVLKDLYDLIKNTYRNLAGIYLFSRPAIVITDAEMIKRILEKDFEHFEDRGTYYRGMHDPVAVLIESHVGSKWSQSIHSKLSNVFSDELLKKLFVNFEMCARKFSSNFENNELDIINVKQISHIYTVSVINECFLNFIELTKINYEEIVNLHHESTIIYLREFALGIYSELNAFVNPERLKSKKHDHLQTFIDEIQKYSKSDDETKNEILKTLREIFISTRKNKKLKTNLEHESLLKTYEFILSSFQMLTSLLCFALFELAHNLEMQQQLRQEIRKLFADNVKIKTLLSENVTIFNAFFQELLRKYPVNPVIERTCTKDYHVPNSKMTIHKGSLIYLPVYGLHHDPEFYPNPNIFDVKRFSSNPPQNYLPFGAGPRKCLGQNFCMLPLKLALISFLKSHHVEKCSLTPEQIKFEAKSYVLMPQQDISLRVKKFE